MRAKIIAIPTRKLRDKHYGWLIELAIISIAFPFIKKTAKEIGGISRTLLNSLSDTPMFNADQTPFSVIRHWTIYLKEKYKKR